MHALTIIKPMNTAAARSKNAVSNHNASSLHEDEAIAALIHLYLELQLPPDSAWQAAQADCRAAVNDRGDGSERTCGVNIEEAP